MPLRVDNMLENDPEYRPMSSNTIECNRSRIVELNYQRNQIVQQRIDAFKELQRTWWLVWSKDAATLSEEYHDLLKMGASIFPHLMIAYCDDPYEYYYELLHEIVFGCQMGAYMVHRGQVFAGWCLFFDWFEHARIPKYIPTPTDRYILNGEIVESQDSVQTPGPSTRVELLSPTHEHQ
ncbi:hypothetical protein F4777DRAFT_549273 [Nemania sp. FL0916]|nr:hypothetical protein F4777DRAFT_549273 [Nemania sp. FL0916]